MTDIAGFVTRFLRVSITALAIAEVQAAYLCVLAQL